MSLAAKARVSARSVLAALFSLGAAACLPVTQPPPPVAGEPEDFPVAYYRQSLAASGEVFRLSSDSRITLLVYRGGRAAKLGHNHVVSARKLGGYVHLAPDIADSRVDLFLRPADWVVDDPDDRATAGEAFSKVLTERAVTDTRANMLGDEVLDASESPFVTVSGTVDQAAADKLTASLDVTVRGVSHRLTTPVRWTRRGERLEINGGFTVMQTAFGITPFSVLGGALVVRDGVVVQVKLVADRVKSGDELSVSAPSPSGGAPRVPRKPV